MSLILNHLNNFDLQPIHLSLKTFNFVHNPTKYKGLHVYLLNYNRFLRNRYNAKCEEIQRDLI